ncbi:SDR family oxidoreductase, partial [Klebsiella pneumoniae]|uniref:SDR family oxidoreductase n=1 Tax=Klebsiella pneumoniae TaxID=573 RepID=UPI001933C484
IWDLAVDGWDSVENGFEPVLRQPVDVSSLASVEAAFAETLARLGQVQILVNNAGINAPAVPVDELPLENWRNVIATNVDGVFLCARAAFGLMRRQQPQGGRIIN